MMALPMKKMFCALRAALILCGALGGCTQPSEPDGGLQIVATLFPQYDFARTLAGGRANVSLLLSPGADAHSFDPSPKDILTVTGADLFIYTGDNMELWARRLLESEDVARAVESGSLTVLDLSAALGLDEETHAHDPAKEEAHTHEEESDPHIWTSFRNAENMCRAIAETLCALDAAGEAVYRENLAAYTAQLHTLDVKMQEMVDSAAAGTVYFGGSFAFACLFDDYGLMHRSVYEGCAAHTEPSAAALDSLIADMRAAGARYVLYDSASEEKTARAVAAETGAEALHIHAIHNITKAELDAGETYLSLSEKNLEVLRKALDA